MSEHPFAQYVRILGKGPRLSRSLTLEETRAAVGLILAGQVEPVQLGAFLCLMRVRTETAAEVAGFALALRDALAVTPELRAGLPPVDLDWPSYAGKSRRPLLFVLSALLLAQNGVRIAMHGTEGHTPGRVYTSQVLTALGLRPAASVAEAARQLAADNFAYVSLDLLHSRLPALMELKALLGVRSPLHTALRNLNPFGARASLMSVFHPNYREVHRDAGALMGETELACFKGEGGEAERRPEKPCLVEGLRGGQPFSEEWPPLWAGSAPESDMDPATVAAVWRGDKADAYSVAMVTATAAVALQTVGRTATLGEAEALARRLWAERRIEALPIAS